MSFSSVSLSNFRNFENEKFSPCPGVNIITGANGSGKTSILEAIAFLGTGKSFRTPRPSVAVSHGSESFTLFAQTDNGDRIGLMRTVSGESRIRINGEDEQTSSSLARITPFRAITPQDVELFGIAGPGLRRAEIDWGCFYLFPGFFSAWTRFRRSLNQRNACLRNPSTRSLMTVVDSEFISSSEEVDNYRRQYVKELAVELMSISSKFLPDFDISAALYSGWGAGKSLKEALNGSKEREIAVGYTIAGPQRADLRVLANGNAAKDLLSRGQLKMLACALRLAEGTLLEKFTGRGCAYLVDDFASELDRSRREILASRLMVAKGQVFITAVDEEDVCAFSASAVSSVFSLQNSHINQRR